MTSLPTIDAACEAAFTALEDGREEAALPPLDRLLAAVPDDPRLWQAKGLLHRGAQDLAPAITAFTEARRLAPDDRLIAFSLAQCLLEAGRPAVGAFEAAQRLSPADLAIRQGLVTAKAAEEGLDQAIAALGPSLGKHSAWVDGHRLMARLQTASGRPELADTSFAAAVRLHPGNASLWEARAAMLLEALRYDDVLAVIKQARRVGNAQAMTLLQAAALSESGALVEAERVFARLPPARVPADLLFVLRHLLRCGRADQVAALARQIGTAPGTEMLVPLFAAAWRATSDPRLHWLEPEALIGVFDLSEQLASIDELASVLRGIHSHVEAPLGQSVRGGTQTDGPLFSRLEPEIVQLRAVIEQAVMSYIAALPSADPDHPTLRHPRDRPLRFAGSWSVRLRSKGHHDSHVHPQGWLSSALYVSLPETLGTDEGDHSGWLALGEPQASLGLDLPPTRWIKPEIGRLVLFPSTMWHGTLPFAAGERLTIAFDIAPPH